MPYKRGNMSSTKTHDEDHKYVMQDEELEDDELR